jgi:hypothetical protein
LRPEDGEERIEQRQIDHLTRPGPDLDIAQRDHRGRRAVDAGDPIGQIHGWEDGFPVGKTVDGRKARDPFDDGAESGALAVRPILAPSGYAHDHELRIELQQTIRTEAHLLEHARPKAFDEDLRGRHERLDEV